MKNSYFERGFNYLGKLLFSYRIHFFIIILIFILFDLELFLFLFIYFNLNLIY